LKDEKTFAMVVGSPLGADVSRFCAQVLRGDHPPCIKKALTKKDLFLFMDRSRDCGDCPLKKLHLGRNSLLMRITHKSKLFGFLVLSLEPDVYIDQEEKGLLEEVTNDIAFGLHNIELGENLDKRTYDLKERVKELNCLWEISNLVETPGISLEAIIKGIANLLPSAWQYPEITCARIILDAKEYKTKNFKETAWKQSSDIMVHQKPVGTVVVYYLEERPQRDEGPFLKEERNLINIIAGRLGEIIERKQGEVELQQSYQKLQKTMEDTIYTIGKIAETRDPYTSGHQKNVSQIATFIAQEMKLPKDRIEGIRIASLVHDIGKISIPAEILNKPTKLSEIEYNLIKDHSQTGHDVLKSIEFPWPIAQIVLQHHERLDGSGYPNKLKGEDILLEARIIGIVDVVEAMSSHRPYRPALGIDKALEEISKNKGILYDFEVVSVCLKLFKKKEFKF
jgi:putative nucleotidyltransferase with HDIG domain